MQTGTGLNTPALTDDHLKHDVYVLRPGFSLRVLHLGARCNQCAVHTRTPRRARLVGAAAAALVRSPRVAPGARLPVVCQRLRVEFIQIKAVE